MSGDPKQMWDFTATTTVPATSRIPIMLEGPLSRHITGANLITSIRDQLFNKLPVRRHRPAKQTIRIVINIHAARDALIAGMSETFTNCRRSILSGTYTINTPIGAEAIRV